MPAALLCMNLTRKLLITQAMRKRRLAQSLQKSYQIVLLEHLPSLRNQPSSSGNRGHGFRMSEISVKRDGGC